MKRNVECFILFLLVVFTIVLPSNQIVTRVKAPYALTELDLRDSKLEEPLVLFCQFAPTLELAAISQASIVQPQTLVLTDDRAVNQTLNLLYRAHSPPVLI